MQALTAKRSGLVGGLVALAAVIGFAVPAGAATYPTYAVVSYSNAPTGSFSIGETRCITTNYWDGWMIAHPMTINVDAPYVYAKNVTAGTDLQYVAARPILKDLATGKVVAYGGWSAWTLAADNAPAHWATQQFNSSNVAGWDVRHVYATQTEMWWSNSNGTITKAVVQLTQYHQIVFTSGSLTSDTLQSTCKNAS